MELLGNLSKKLKINTLNVNGWSASNDELRKSLVTFNDPDIICMTETHLKLEETINISNYDYFGVNRKVDKNVKNQRGSGGCGMLVKSDLNDYYDINTCFTHNDNVIAIELRCQ